MIIRPLSSLHFLALICAMGMFCASVLAMPGTAACARVSGFISDSRPDVVDLNGEQVSYAYDVALRHMHFAADGPNRTFWAYDDFSSTTQSGVIVTRCASHAYYSDGNTSSRCSAYSVNNGLSWSELAYEVQNQFTAETLNSGTTRYYDDGQHGYDHGHMSDGPSLYAYVGNGPTGATDPLGLEPGIIMVSPDQSHAANLVQAQ